MLPEDADLIHEPPILEAAAAPVDLGVPEPFWGYIDVALVIGLTFAFLVGAAFVFMLSGHGVLRADSNPLMIIGSNVALYAFLYIALWLVLGLRYGQPVLSSLGWRRSRFPLWVAAGGGAVLAFGIAGLAALLHTPKVDSPLDKLLSSRVSLVIFGAMAVTVAPLFEELLFRGFIQPLLSRTFGVIAGILLTAIIFGSLHGPEYGWAWQYVAAVSLVGVVLGWVRAHAKSIIPSTVMHACYNAMFVVALAVTKQT